MARVGRLNMRREEERTISKTEGGEVREVSRRGNFLGLNEQELQEGRFKMEIEENKVQDHP